MSNKVTFDYSKATSFIKEHEIANMKKLVLDAKEELKNRLKKSKVIQMSFSLLVSVDPIWVQGQLLSF